MSWFSDFAKTALSEAQKRIDKVLDIDENSTPRTDNPPLAVEDSYDANLSKYESSVKTSLQTKSTLSSHKLSFSNNAAKKRVKPNKLGSSLSKRLSSDATAIKQSVKQDKINREHSLAYQVDEYEDIPLSDNSCLLSGSSPALHHSENGSKLSNGSYTSPTAQALPPTTLFNRHNEEAVTSATNVISEESTNEELKQTYTESHTTSVDGKNGSKCVHDIHHDAVITPTTVPVHVPSDTSHSPCGSTTTSSEIDILEHESTMSEASAVLKFDGRVNMTSVENTFHSRMSPDQIDSEASDIVRISGYCSSPLSVGSCDGTQMFAPQRKSPVHFPDEVTIPLSTKEADASSHSEVPLIDDEARSAKSTDSFADNDTTLQGDFDNAAGVDATAPVAEKTDSISVALEDEPKLIDTEKKTSLSLLNNAETVMKQTASSTSLCSTIVDVTGETIHLEDSLPEDEQAACNENKNSEINAKSLSDEESSKKEQIIPTPPDPTEIGHCDMDALTRKMEVYEQQILSLSLSNAKLSEENDNLGSELSNIRLEREKALEDQQQNLLDTVEKLSIKLQTLELENSDISSQLASTQVDLSQRLSNEQVQHLLAEKEESIQGLLQEGEALSKQHLQQNNTIKKLRSRLTEREDANKDLSEKLSKLEEQKKSLKLKLTEVQGQSTEDRGAAERLSEAYQEREAELQEMKSKLEDAEEKRRAAQATLDAAYKDLAELNKKQIALQSDRETELREHEVKVTKRTQQEIEKIQQEHDHQMHMRLLQLGELQDSLERNEAIYARKEDKLKKEIRDIQQRLQESELRNQELSESISESTRPILRQMENLQSTYSAQAKTWEALEKSLTARLSDAQVQLTSSQDKERNLQMSLLEMKSRLASTEQQLAETRTENTSLLSEVEALRRNASQYDDKLSKMQKELQVSEQSCEEIKSKARRDRLTLENQLDMEKVRAEVEKKKYLTQLETWQKEKERLLWMNRSDSVVSSASALNADAESVASSDTFNNVDVFERQSSSGAPASGIYDIVRSGQSGSAILENLQSQLKMRDGEIAQLQGEINTLERTRSSMAEEIVRLTNENEDLVEVTKEVESLKRKLKEVEARHDAVLTMYGEKAEEAEELKLDLEDVKSMYRSQIDALLKSQ